jgi:hypothetical protein
MAGMPDTGTATAKQRQGPKERFTKVYPKGWSALAGLVDNRPAAKLYVFLADNCGHDNALACTYELLSEELDLHERTIRRAVRDLEERGHVVVAKVGTANVYILNPAEIWKTYEDHKRFCGFRTRTLVSKKHNPDLKRRLTHMVNSKPEQPAHGDDVQQDTDDVQEEGPLLRIMESERAD